MSTNENRRVYALKAYEKKKTLYKKNLKKKKNYSNLCCRNSHNESWRLNEEQGMRINEGTSTGNYQKVPP